MLWQLKNIYLKGKKDFRLENISIDIDNGITAIMGHSGAGKSTLLNLLVDYEKADSGSIENFHTTTNDQLQLYWVPSNHGLWPHLTVEEHLHCVINKNDTKKCDVILADFAIINKKQSYPNELSCGEASRLSIARAIAANPATIILDEPLLNVDPARKLKFWELILNYAKNDKFNIIYASHSPKFVIGSAQNIICMHKGVIEFSGSVNELYRSPKSLQLGQYLGEINHFNNEELKLFLNLSSEINGEKTLYRPEEIKVEKTSKGNLLILNSKFMGSITETEIENISTKTRKIIFHQNAISTLSNGDSVIIKQII
jgi:iron(III) transport system ATP-binding protein